MLPTPTKAVLAPSCLGVALGSNRLDWVRTDAGGKLVEQGEISLSTPLFVGSVSPQAGETLRQALRSLAGKKPLRVQATLPSGAGAVRVFELESMPAAAEKENFFAWKFARALGGESGDWVVRTQFMGRQGGRSLVLAAGLNRAWLDLVLEAFASAALSASVLDLACHQAFNVVEKDLGAGLWIFLEADSYTLVRVDDQARPLECRTGWREGGEDSQALAARIHRQWMAMRSPGAERCTLAGSGDEAEALKPRLEASLDLKVEISAMGQDQAPGWLAAVAR